MPHTHTYHACEHDRMLAFRVSPRLHLYALLNGAAYYPIVLQFEFDPFTDIALDEAGCWWWNSDKRALHAYVARYFETWNDDGRPAATAPRPAQR
jgi:hypothetical protein